MTDAEVEQIDARRGLISRSAYCADVLRAALPAPVPVVAGQEAIAVDEPPEIAREGLREAIEAVEARPIPRAGETCPNCRGLAFIEEEPCFACGGTGKVQ